MRPRLDFFQDRTDAAAHATLPKTRFSEANEENSEYETYTSQTSYQHELATLAQGHCNCLM